MKNPESCETNVIGGAEKQLSEYKLLNASETRKAEERGVRISS